MPRNHTTPRFDSVRALEKFAVSGFVIFSFVAYAVHEYFTTSNGALNLVAPSPTKPVAQALPDQSQPPSASSQNSQVAPTFVPTNDSAARPTATRPPARPVPAPMATPAIARTAAGAYKDGTFMGPSVNAMYGLVRVQAVIQNGQLKNVQALEYPTDRRTSQRINQQAIPWLQTEVIQAQSAKVNIISGATLTSQAFMRSLQTALDSAKN